MNHDLGEQSKLNLPKGSLRTVKVAEDAEAVLVKNSTRKTTCKTTVMGFYF